MAIVDFRNKSIGFYDSMGSNNNSCLEVSINLDFFEMKFDFEIKKIIIIHILFLGY